MIYLTGYSDALVVTAVLNSLGVLMHRRPIAANKILNSVLNFNPLKLANAPMTPKNKVNMRAIERTTRALLVNVLKRYELPAHEILAYNTHNKLEPAPSAQMTQTSGEYSTTSSVCIACARISLRRPAVNGLLLSSLLTD